MLPELAGGLFPYIIAGILVAFQSSRRDEARWGYRIRRGRKVITGLRIGRLYLGWGTACILGPYHSCMINRGVRIGWLLWTFEIIRRNKSFEIDVEKDLEDFTF